MKNQQQIITFVEVMTRIKLILILLIICFASSIKAQNINQKNQEFNYVLSQAAAIRRSELPQRQPATAPWYSSENPNEAPAAPENQNLQPAMEARSKPIAA